MLRATPLYVSVSASAYGYCAGLDLRLGRVGVQVDALEIEDVILGVVAVVQRVVAGDGKRIVKGDLGAAE